MGFIVDKNNPILNQCKTFHWNNAGAQNTVFLNDEYQIDDQKVVIKGGFNLTEETPSVNFNVGFDNADTALAGDWVDLGFTGAIILLFNPPVIAVGTSLAVVGIHDPIPFMGLIGAHWEDGSTLNTKMPGATSAGGKPIFIGASGSSSNRIQWIAIDAEQFQIPFTRIAISHLSIVTS